MNDQQAVIGTVVTRMPHAHLVVCSKTDMSVISLDLLSCVPPRAAIVHIPMYTFVLVFCVCLIINRVSVVFVSNPLYSS